MYVLAITVAPRWNSAAYLTCLLGAPARSGYFGTPVLHLKSEPLRPSDLAAPLRPLSTERGRANAKDRPAYGNRRGLRVKAELLWRRPPVGERRRFPNGCFQANRWNASRIR